MNLHTQKKKRRLGYQRWQKCITTPWIAKLYQNDQNKENKYARGKAKKLKIKKTTLNGPQQWCQHWCELSSPLKLKSNFPKLVVEKQPESFPPKTLDTISSIKTN